MIGGRFKAIILACAVGVEGSINASAWDVVRVWLDQSASFAVSAAGLWLRIVSQR